MNEFILIAATLIATAFARRLLALLADFIATLTALYYGVRLARLSQALLATKGKNEEVHYDRVSSRAQRRLLRRHLTITMAMTAHASMFPSPSARARGLVSARGTGV